MIDCPFRILWSISGVKDKSVPTIFRKFFITKCNPTHNYGMSFESFMNASRMSKATKKRTQKCWIV